MAEKKPHEADVYAAAQIARAVKFSAVIQLSPHDRRYAKGMESYPEALEGAALLNAVSEFGRRAVIYAHTPEGRAFPVSPELAAMAGLVGPSRFGLARRLLRRARDICRAQPGFGSPAYRGDPLEAVGLEQQAARLMGTTR